MREIKFRAWDKKSENMLDIRCIDFDQKGNVTGIRSIQFDGEDFDFPMHEIDRVELLEWTGLKDKNGKKIYEGDIVKNGIGIGKIVFGSYSIGRDDWGVEHITPGFSLEWHDGSGHSGINDITDYEVIGNIYKNPKLLK